MGQRYEPARQSGIAAEQASNPTIGFVPSDAGTALRESEDRFRTLADNIAQFAWMADRNGWIFWYNRRWYDYTGTTLEEMEGWGWTKVHHPDHVDRVVARIQRSWETGEPWDDTFPLRGRDGGYRWFLSRALPIRDSYGQIVRWFGTNTDVTEQRHAEELIAERTRALEQALEERQAALDVRDAFLTTLAHDLKAPLANLVWQAQVLRRRVGNGRATSASLEDALDAILSCAGEALGTIDELRDLTQIRAGSAIALHRESIDLLGLVNQVTRGLLTAEHPIRVEAGANTVQVFADRARLSRVLANLLDNAAKYSPRNSEIVIRIDTEVIDDATWGVIEVVDHGRGIPDSELAHVFERYKRGANALDTTGQGLGLASVDELVRLHGGTVQVESQLGLGSTFTVRLPPFMTRSV